MPTLLPPSTRYPHLLTDFTAAELATPAAVRHGYPILTVGSNASECGACDGEGRIGGDRCTSCYGGLVPNRRFAKSDTASVMLRIVDLSEELPELREPPITCTLASFEESNCDDEETLEKVRALKPGQSVKIGGGASPLTRITRLRQAVAS